MITITEVPENKKQYLDLLLLADEQEDMIDRYLESGTLFALADGGTKAVCVVTKESDGVYELKNIAVQPGARRRGYGKTLIAYLFSRYPDCQTMCVGTGDVPSALGFYQSCGFRVSHRVKDFFIKHYNHPMIEDGVQLRDMVYLRRDRPPAELSAPRQGKPE